jgi:hypothetical protein
MFHHSEQLLNCEGGNNKRTILLGGEEAKNLPFELKQAYSCETQTAAKVHK